MKKSLIATFVLLTVISCSKNDDDTIPPVDEKQTEVYTAGYIEVPNGPTTMQKATIWKNGVAQQLSSTESFASKVLLVGNDIYTVGRELEGSKSVAKLWKNGIATNPINSTKNTEAMTLALAAGGDTYILIREWNNSGSEYKVLKNGTPIVLSPPNNNNIYQLLDVFVAGNDVYVAGTVKEFGFNITKATLWKNGSPVFLPSVIANAQNAANKVFVSGNDVYVLGTEDNLSQTGIVLWKNGNSTRITEDSQDASGSSIFVSGNDVYITGSRYDPTTFTPVTTLWKNGTPIFNKNVNDTFFTSVFVLNNNVYMAGRGYLNNSLAYLWKNGVLETPTIENANFNSVFVIEK